MAKKFRAVFLTLCMLIGLAPTTVLADDPTVSYTAAWNDDGTAITLTVDPDVAGTVYYAVQESGSSAPVDVTGNATACTTDTNTISIAQSTQTAKDIYVKYIDEDGNQYVTSSLSLAAYGTATEVTEGPVSVIEKGTLTVEGSRLSETSISLTATSTVDGYLYYVVKPSSETAPSDEAILSGTPVQLTANTPVSFTVTSVSSDELTAYFRFSDASGNVYSETTTATIPAYTTSSYSAEVESYSSNFRTVTEGYASSDAGSITITITNTGENDLSFSVDTTDTNYSTFSSYFAVTPDTDINIAVGESATITVTAKTGLTAGTYSSSFVLKDEIDDSNTLTLDPITLSITVTSTSSSTSDVTIPSEFPYTPYRSAITGSGLINYYQYMISTDVVYCANYHYTLGSDLYYYTKKYGLISDVSNKVLDSYTGLDPDADPLYYPPNNYGYTPVKTGSDTSTVRDDVARVLYFGYPNDALQLLDANGNDKNYDFSAQMGKRRRYAFMIATQCAIWHYTDGNDYSGDNMKSDTNLHKLYPGLGDWVWNDAQNIYNLLIEESVSSRFDDSITLASVSAENVPEDFQVDLYVADNPVNYPGYGALWSQNLVTGRVAATSTDTIDIPVTKVWNDDGDVENRPDSITVVLYQNGTDTGNTLELNSTNNWTGSFTGLATGYTYTIGEVSVNGYTSEISGSQTGGFTITNTSTATVNVSVTKQWVGDEADSITVNLLADGAVVQTRTIEKDSNGDISYTFEGLDKYNNDGMAIVYSVVETATSGDNTYQSISTGQRDAQGNYVLTITNSNLDTTSLKVEKKWIGTEGDAVTVDLYQLHSDGSKTLIQQKQITSDMNWTYTFTGLRTYDSSSNVISYVIEEEDADDYQLVERVNGDGTVILTNVELTELTVTKEWEGQTGEYADVNLLENGEVTDTVRLTEDNDWTYTWTDLPKYDADTGDEISYSVSEVSMSGYTVTITKISDQEFLINNKWVQTEKPTQERHIVPNTADAPLTDTE